MKRLDRMLKRVAEMLWEAGFIVLPSFRDASYLEDTFEGMNVKYLKVQNGKKDGEPVTETVDPWKWDSILSRRSK